MPNGTYGGVRGRKTKVGRKLLRFPPTRLWLFLWFDSMTFIGVCQNKQFFVFIIMTNKESVIRCIRKTILSGKKQKPEFWV